MYNHSPELLMSRAGLAQDMWVQGRFTKNDIDQLAKERAQSLAQD
jgi:hypothetical protein